MYNICELRKYVRLRSGSSESCLDPTSASLPVTLNTILKQPEGSTPLTKKPYSKSATYHVYVRSEVLTRVTMSIWSPGLWRRCLPTFRKNVSSASSVLKKTLQDGGNTFVQKVGNHFQDYTQHSSRDQQSITAYTQFTLGDSLVLSNYLRPISNLYKHFLFLTHGLHVCTL
jgi:hypothetical protein